MSYWVSLQCEACGRPLNSIFKRHGDTMGGTYPLEETHECELNVTYNYGPHFVTVLGNHGLASLKHQLGSDAIPILERAITTLGTQRDSDYWKPTPGNAGYALSILLDWAKEHPQGRFDVI